MGKSEESILDELYQAVCEGDSKKARRQAEAVVEKGVSPNLALKKMKKALTDADAKFMRKECLSADVAESFNAMQAAFKIIEPHLKAEPKGFKGNVIIGTLKGNLQGLGKDIVAAALRSAGFQVVDLGLDVSPEDFVNAAEKEKAHVIAVSVSVSETVPFLKDLVELLKKKKLRDQVKLIVGGRAVSNATVEKYGVDAYVQDEWECVKKVRELLSH